MEDEKQIVKLQEENYKLRKELEEYKNRSNLFEKVFDKVDSAIYIYDEDTRLIYMNSASEKIEGLKRKHLIGKSEKEIWNTDIVKPVIEDEMPREKNSLNYETPTGKRVNIYHNMYAYYVNNKVKGVFSIIEDMTAITNMVMSVYDLQGKIIESGKNEVLNNGTRYTLDNILGESRIMKECIKNASKVARHNSNILIYGETGTGKELFAQGIHNAGKNHKEPFIGLNCSAIPSNLIESLLFGTKQGSFTGALDTKGLFEQAGEGTLFLDEINSMPIDMQSKLLRVLQEKKYRGVGDTKDKYVKCKVISSTNVEPREAIRLGKLRQDLYYRIAVVTITIPPLRERISDIPLLLNYFINKYNLEFNTKIQSIDRKLIDLCSNYNWPGNVRELEHMVKSALNLSEGCERLLTVDMFPEFANDTVVENQKQVPKPIYLVSQEKIDLNKKLNEYEAQLIKKALFEKEGNIAATARQLSIHRSVLYSKMKKLDIDLDNLQDVY